MALHHAVLRGSNRAIGFSLGRLAQEFHGFQPPSAEADSETRLQNAYLEENYPAHFARMTGMAEAFGERVHDGSFDFSNFGTAPGSAGCSAVHYPPLTTAPGRGFVCRNLDFTVPANFQEEKSPFPFKDTYVLELYPDGCFPSLVMFCFQLFGLPLEGINSEGLVVVHLADADTRLDHPDLPTGRTTRGFNEFLPIQFLLDNCSDAVEAEAALERMDHYCHAVPVHLLVADRSGRSFVFEYGPEARRRVCVHGNPAAPLRVTNFPLNRLADPAGREAVEAHSRENGLHRYQTLGRALKRATQPYSEEVIRDINDGVLVHSELEGSLSTTVFQCLYDTTSSSVEVALLPTLERARGTPPFSRRLT